MMDPIEASLVEAERKDDLHQVKFKRGFYNTMNGKKVAASNRPSVINPGAIWGAANTAKEA